MWKLSKKQINYVEIQRDRYRVHVKLNTNGELGMFLHILLFVLDYRRCYLDSLWSLFVCAGGLLYRLPEGNSWSGTELVFRITNKRRKQITFVVRGATLQHFAKRLSHFSFPLIDVKHFCVQTVSLWICKVWKFLLWHQRRLSKMCFLKVVDWS